VINKHIKYQKVFNRLALLLVITFAIQIASYAFFYHTHKINGKLYSHAHPGCDGHSHSATDLAFYQQLQTIIAGDIPNLLADIHPVVLNGIKAETSLCYQSLHTRFNTGRAPPVA
jgi:hypothetical protein